MARSLIRALGLRDVVVVGHSFGGTTALALAVTNPEDVRAYVVVGSACHGPIGVPPLYRLLALPRVGEGIALAVGKTVGPERIARGIREAFGPDAAAIPTRFIELRQRLWTRPVTSATLARERAGIDDALDLLGPHFRDVRRPVHLVYGDGDLNTARSASRLAREIPGASLVVLPGAGHYLPVSRPDALAEIVARAAAGAASTSSR